MIDRRIIICGARNWKFRTPIYDLIVVLNEKANRDDKRLVVVEGEQKGADKTARFVAERLGIEVDPHRARWDLYGKGAGPIRNKEMLDTDPEAVFAFKDGFDTTLRHGGTEDMIRRTIAKGTPFMVYDSKGGQWNGCQT